MLNVETVNNNPVDFKAPRRSGSQQPQSYNQNAGLPIGKDAYVKYQANDHEKRMEKYMKYMGYGAIIAGCALLPVGISKLVKLPYEKDALRAAAEQSKAAVKQIKGETEKPLNNNSIFEDLSDAMSLKEMSLAESVEKETKGIINNITNFINVKLRGGTEKKTILLYGPPGTGKTTYAKAIAKHFEGAKFVSLDITKMKDMWHGATEKNINAIIDQICEEADRMAVKYNEELAKVIGENIVKKGNQLEILKAIEKAKSEGKKIPVQERIFVFIDEIDSVMMVDSGSGAKLSNDILNEFKKGFTEKLGKRHNIITMGATNLEIDPIRAMTGDGKMLDKPMLDRFQKKVRVPNPDKGQTKKWFISHYSKLDNVADELKKDNPLLDKLAEFTSQEEHGVSFRKLEAISDEAANATAESNEKLNIKDILNALKTMKEDLKMTDKEIDKILAA